MAKPKVPALVGRKEMAAILGRHPNNAVRDKLPDLPPTLQEEYGAEHIGVAATALWRRDDIEAYAAVKHEEARTRAARGRKAARERRKATTTQ